jgi:formylmethanofuran dehydrogenase subunit E
MEEHSDDLQILLGLSAENHDRLCPRQVLGVRMGLLAGKILGIEVPQKDKRLFTLSEIDGCGAGGISVATGCSISHRTMRIMDYGKMAATFVDTLLAESAPLSFLRSLRKGGIANWLATSACRMKNYWLCNR